MDMVMSECGSEDERDERIWQELDETTYALRNTA